MKWSIFWNSGQKRTSHWNIYSLCLCFPIKVSGTPKDGCAKLFLMKIITFCMLPFCHTKTERQLTERHKFRVWRIYSNIQIFLIRIFIRVFVSIIFWIRIYSDIRSCQLFGYEYIRIFVRSKILIRIYSNIRSHQFSGHKQIPTMFLSNFSGYYTLLMDNLLITMVKCTI